MIRTIKIENFKSIRKLELVLGRVTVLIGANGAGKSNILEAIAFAGAAAAGKLGNEFLVPRGMRMLDNPRYLLPAFPDCEADMVTFSVGWDSDEPLIYHVAVDGTEAASGWTVKYRSTPELDSFLGAMQQTAVARGISDSQEVFPLPPPVQLEALRRTLQTIPYYGELFSKISFPAADALNSVLVYAPENRELRTFAEEGQILPLGVRGEGLFRLLKILSQQDNGAKLAELKEKLHLIDWFEDFEFQKDAVAYERRLMIRDRHLSEDLAYFDQRSANEGFLFLLFYFCLFLSDATPPFFAVDNIDTSLNPKLCAQLVRELVTMAKENDKQAILTTHNPAVLDGLDLTDPDQKLYVVRRNLDGETIVNRIEAPEVEEGQTPVPLSEAFLRGYLGGLPDNF